jgi:RyR domain
MNSEQAARIAHEVNRAYCLRLGDTSQLPWEQAPDWQKKSAIDGIEFHWRLLRARVQPLPSDSHNSWLKQKEQDGWKYGPVKDPEKKEHPCFVPYEQLPAEQQTKDYLFGAVAAASFPLSS